MKSIGQHLPKIPKEWQAKLKQTQQHVLEDDDVKRFLAEHQHELAPNAIEIGMNQLMAYVSKKNDTHVVPGYFPILQVNQGQIELSYEQTEADYVREQDRKRQRRVAYVDIPKSIRTASFDQLYLDPEHPEKTQIAKALIQFVHDYTSHPTQFHKGLYLYGQFGVGKTYLMGALVNELAKQGVSSMVLNTATFISQLRQQFNQPNQTIWKQLNKVKTVPVLVLDDIGMETMTEWSRDEVLGVILQYRMQEELPTFFTSNLSMQALEQHLSETKQSTNTLRAKRLMERIRYLATEVTMTGKSLR